MKEGPMFILMCGIIFGLYILSKAIIFESIIPLSKSFSEVAITISHTQKEILREFKRHNDIMEEQNRMFKSRSSEVSE